MKKLFFAIAIFAALALCGCASLLKAAGGVTAADATARNSQVDQEIAALRQTIDQLGAKAAAIDGITQSVDEMKAQIEKVDELVQRIEDMSSRLDEASQLTGAVDELRMALEDLKSSTAAIPVETLARLARLITRAIEDGSAAETP